jgi:hypothetical protein
MFRFERSGEGGPFVGPGGSGDAIVCEVLDLASGGRTDYLEPYSIEKL